MNLKDNSFDTVVDTFGLEYYNSPEIALKGFILLIIEMKRVCKKDGLILILTSGLSHYSFLNLFLEYKTPHNVCQSGFFPNRDWS